MNAIPNNQARRILPPSQTYATPNPLPTDVDWPVPERPSYVGPGNIPSPGNNPVPRPIIG